MSNTIYRIAIYYGVRFGSKQSVTFDSSIVPLKEHILTLHDVITGELSKSHVTLTKELE